MSSRRLLLLAAFFLSGLAALVFELVWTRLLLLAIGTTATAVGVVLGAFMGGMALGSALAGRRWVSRLDPVIAFAALEGFVGAYALSSPPILEGIAWAMYGMPAARGSRDSIRRRNAPPRARVEVELEFALGAHQYRIVRGLNHAELYQDGEPAPVANSLGSVTERVTRLLGMSRDEFFNTYFTGQKELAVMSAMKPVERSQFLSRVLGYDKLRIAQDRLRAWWRLE